jgi:hypothetical protein
MDSVARLTDTLAGRYQLERELGQGGMANELAAGSRGSATVAEATRGMRPKTPPASTLWNRSARHFSDTSRAVASATCPTAIRSAPSD